MRKTFLLEADAPYTSGTILVVAESLEEIKEMVMRLHRERKEKLSHLRFYNKVFRENVRGALWQEAVNEMSEIRKEIDQRYWPIAYISTGLILGKDGWFVSDWNLKRTQKQLQGKPGWYVALEFYSDLNPGFITVTDFCS